MKILHLIFVFETGGAENIVIDIINQQIKDNDVSLFVINNIYSQSMLSRLDKRVRVYLIEREPGSKNLIKLLRINYLIWKFKPNIIHCHESNIIKYIFNHASYNTVLTVHAIHLPMEYANLYNKVVAISNSVKTVLEKKGVNSEVIYNGVDCNLIKRVDYQNKNISTFRIIQLGRLVHECKGQDIAIKALKILNDNYPDLEIQLDFIGDGPSFDFLNELSKTLKVDKNIRFLGVRNRKYIYENLCNYNLLIQPSYYEGFGLTIVEGIFAGLPIIISDIDGPKEIINEGKYGKIFLTGDCIDLANTIHQLILNKVSSTFINDARLYAINNFSLDVMIDRYNILYKSILNNRIQS